MNAHDKVRALAGVAPLDQPLAHLPGPATSPLWIGLLGNFRLLKTGLPVAIPSGGKVEALFSALALRYRQRVPRETLLALLWPNQAPTRAAQSLRTLVYSLHKQFADVLSGAGPVVQSDGFYWLNCAAGVGVDLVAFDTLVELGETQLSQHDRPAAIAAFRRAVELYRDDLGAGSDVYAAVERERLRACYLSLLLQLADDHYSAGDYRAALAAAQRLLASDPCREDAHRLVMRCYLRRGERAQALRQYQLCVELLRAEFDTAPERATTGLYEQIRCSPEAV